MNIDDVGVRVRRGFRSPQAQRSVARQMSEAAQVNGTARSSRFRHSRTRSEGGTFVRYDEPCHSTRDSLLSTSSGYNNYRGFLNLALILLVLSNARVALENVLKYGLLADLSILLNASNVREHVPNIALLFFTVFFVVFAFIIEKALARNYLSESVARVLMVMNITIETFFPVIVIVELRTHAFSAALCLFFYSVLSLKLISYYQVNGWCRRALAQHGNLNAGGFSLWSETEKRMVLQYPANLTFHDLLYFLAAPTLCYELNFPRSPRVRKWFVAKRIVEFTFLLAVITALVQQWIMPLLKNAVEPLVDMEAGRMLERLLKLAIPNLLIWLLFFYALFHSFLNLTAELLCFGDREFYRDWWNSSNIKYFWQNWNIPVHKWALRHVYKPMLRAGFSKPSASIFVFFVSASFHEYLVSVPLGLFRLWAFGGMLAQLPLQFITSRLNSKTGNIVVWFGLILGQPMCILMYLHDWYVLNYGEKYHINPQIFSHINTTGWEQHSDL